MIIDERKYNIVVNEDGSVTAVPKPFIPNSKDIQEYWDNTWLLGNPNVLDNIEYLFKVKYYTDDHHKPTTAHTLKYDEKKGSVEPSVTFTEEHPFCFNSEESAHAAIAIIGQDILLSLYKI